MRVEELSCLTACSNHHFEQVRYKKAEGHAHSSAWWMEGRHRQGCVLLGSQLARGHCTAQQPRRVSSFVYRLTAAAPACICICNHAWSAIGRTGCGWAGELENKAETNNGEWPFAALLVLKPESLSFIIRCPGAPTSSRRRGTGTHRHFPRSACSEVSVSPQWQRRCVSCWPFHPHGAGAAVRTRSLWTNVAGFCSSASACPGFCRISSWTKEKKSGQAWQLLSHRLANARGANLRYVSALLLFLFNNRHVQVSCTFFSERYDPINRLCRLMCFSI